MKRQQGKNDGSFGRKPGTSGKRPERRRHPSIPFPAVVRGDGAPFGCMPFAGGMAGAVPRRQNRRRACRPHLLWRNSMSCLESEIKKLGFGLMRLPKVGDDIDP